jgi:hypothetical protein
LKKYTAIFNKLSENSYYDISFESNKEETDIYEFLKLDGYKLYQFIDHDFLYNMNTDELDKKGIIYSKILRVKKTWFGLIKKNIYDILIHPCQDFFYPYQYGHYFYLYTKKVLQVNDFKIWIDKNFVNRFADFDELVGSKKTNNLKLLNDDDYILITNHDYQTQFGIASKNKITESLVQKLTDSSSIEIKRIDKE